MKIKVMRELRNYAKYKRSRQEILSRTKEILSASFKSKIFNEFVNYAFKNAIKRSLRLRAE